MGIELEKESVRINDFFDETEIQTIFEDDIVMPDVKPDVKEILSADAQLIVQNVESDNEKVVVEGCIVYKVLYLSSGEKEEIKGVNSSSDFSQEITVGGSGMLTAKVRCDVAHIDCKIVNDRKLNIKTVVQMTCKSYRELYLDVVKGISGEQDGSVQVLAGEVELNRFLGMGEDVAILHEPIVLADGFPEIGEMLQTDLKIASVETGFVDGNFLIEGKMSFMGMYLSQVEDDAIHVVNSEFSFGKAMEIPGFRMDAEHLTDVRILDGKYSVRENEDGERKVIDLEITIKCNGEAYEKMKCGLMEDAYSVNGSLHIQKEMATIQNVRITEQTTFMVKELFSIEEGMPECKEMFAVTPSVSVNDYTVGNGKIVVQGVCAYHMLYISNTKSKPVQSLRVENEFTQTFDIKGLTEGMRCDLHAEMQHVSYAVRNGTRIEMNADVTLKMKFMEQMQIPCITEIEETLPEETGEVTQKSSGFVIYFVQPGDSMWNIAKRYKITREKLQVYNTDIDEAIAGTQMLIPKR